MTSHLKAANFSNLAWQSQSATKVQVGSIDLPNIASKYVFLQHSNSEPIGISQKLSSPKTNKLLQVSPDYLILTSARAIISPPMASTVLPK